MPGAVELALTVPASLGPANELIEDFKARVLRMEEEMAQKRRHALPGSEVAKRSSE